MRKEQVRNGWIFQIGPHKAWYDEKTRRIRIYYFLNTACISSKKNISELSQIISEILSRVSSVSFSESVLSSSNTESISMFIDRINANLLLSSGLSVEIKMSILLDGDKRSMFTGGAYSSTNLSRKVANQPNISVKSPAIERGYVISNNNFPNVESNGGI